MKTYVVKRIQGDSFEYLGFFEKLKPAQDFYTKIWISGNDSLLIQMFEGKQFGEGTFKYSMTGEIVNRRLVFKRFK